MRCFDFSAPLKQPPGSELWEAEGFEGLCLLVSSGGLIPGVHPQDERGVNSKNQEEHPQVTESKSPSSSLKSL